MILAISFQLYKYLLTNGQGHLKDVLRNAREGEGLKFDDHPLRQIGPLSSSANSCFLYKVWLFLDFVLFCFFSFLSLFSVKHIDTGASYQGNDDNAACKRQSQRTNKVSISVAPVVDSYKSLASYFAALDD